MAGRGLLQKVVFAYLGFDMVRMYMGGEVDPARVGLYGVIILVWSLWFLLEMLGLVPKLG